MRALARALGEDLAEAPSVGDEHHAGEPRVRRHAHREPLTLRRAAHLRGNLLQHRAGAGDPRGAARAPGVHTVQVEERLERQLELLAADEPLGHGLGELRRQAAPAASAVPPAAVGGAAPPPAALLLLQQGALRLEEVPQDPLERVAHLVHEGRDEGEAVVGGGGAEGAADEGGGVGVAEEDAEGGLGGDVGVGVGEGVGVGAGEEGGQQPPGGWGEGEGDKGGVHQGEEGPDGEEGGAGEADVGGGRGGEGLLLLLLLVGVGGRRLAGGQAERAPDVGEEGEHEDCAEGVVEGCGGLVESGGRGGVGAGGL